MAPAALRRRALALLCAASASAAAATAAPRGAGAAPPNVLFVVGDDVGYSDFGYFNDQKTITPTIDGLLEDGIFLTDYYTFKICSPSRAAMITGRYPWGAGFYDMSADADHCTTNSTALPQLLKPLGYKTHALGKWDVGYAKKECSPTYRGFDTFFGYYLACEADYWYHNRPGAGVPGDNCTRTGMGVGDAPTDLSNSTGPDIRPSNPSLNGTYNTRLLADEAARLVTAHDPADPFYMYLAFMAVHDGCAEPSNSPFANLGKQAPMATVDLYNTTVLDTYKVAGAMYTELDSGIETVIRALKANKMWDTTVLIFVSDNGGPLDHCTNEPLRGGKHTFFEGGVRVMSFVSGPLIPPARRGTRWSGMAASADWYKTITEGIAGGTVPENTGYRPPDALNVWGAIMDGSAGPRTEVVHQVQNQWICDVTQPKGGCVSAIRMGEMKLIIGGPGDSRTVEKPAQCTIPPPAPDGYKAPCPQRGFVTGCDVACPTQSDNCRECFGNRTLPPLVTATAAACQAACQADHKCGYFEWLGGASGHGCIFHCKGAANPGTSSCFLGRQATGRAHVCGPKHNDSSAPAPAPAPPAPQPTPPGLRCPVPFGLSGGVIEPGTDHARAIGLKGNTVTALACDPWCLFNLTSDIGERADLGGNPAYQALALKMAKRLRYHASTGPMPAFIWPPSSDEWTTAKQQMCANDKKTGYVEPVDLDDSTVTLLD